MMKMEENYEIITYIERFVERKLLNCLLFFSFRNEIKFLS